MIKKLLILPLIGGIMSFGAFASADTVDGFASENKVCSWSISDLTENTVDEGLLSSNGGYGYYDSVFMDEGCYDDNNMTVYFCVSSSDFPFEVGYYGVDWATNTVNVSSSNYCFTSPLYLGDASFGFSKDISGKLYFSKTSLIAPSSSNGGSDNSSSIVPSIPSSFTSGITALVSNFGSIIVGWLPTIILVALGITAIFALFRVVRNYARSSFNG